MFGQNLEIVLSHVLYKQESFENAIKVKLDDNTIVHYKF